MFNETSITLEMFDYDITKDQQGARLAGQSGLSDYTDSSDIQNYLKATSKIKLISANDVNLSLGLDKSWVQENYKQTQRVLSKKNGFSMSTPMGDTDTFLRLKSEANETEGYFTEP